jgi:hypothetical protein
LCEVALTFKLTTDPEATFSPFCVAKDFALSVFFIVSIDLAACVVEGTDTMGVVEGTDTMGVVEGTDTMGVVEGTGTNVDTEGVVTIGQTPPVFTTVSC